MADIITYQVGKWPQAALLLPCSAEAAPVSLSWHCGTARLSWQLFCSWNHALKLYQPLCWLRSSFTLCPPPPPPGMERDPVLSELKSVDEIFFLRGEWSYIPSQMSSWSLVSTTFFWREEHWTLSLYAYQLVRLPLLIFPSTLTYLNRILVFGHSAVPILLYVQLHSYQMTHQERKCNSLTPAQHINFSHIPFFLFCYSTQKVMTSARKNVCERNDSTAFSLPPIVRNMFSEA